MVIDEEEEGIGSPHALEIVPVSRVLDSPMVRVHHETGQDSVMLPEAPQMLSIHGARVVADNDEGDEVEVVQARLRYGKR